MNRGLNLTKTELIFKIIYQEFNKSEATQCGSDSKPEKIELKIGIFSLVARIMNVNENAGRTASKADRKYR